jgi:hypothetical protein
MDDFLTIKIVLSALATMAISRFLVPYMRQRSKEVCLPEGYDGMLLMLEKRRPIANLLCLGSFAGGVCLSILGAFDGRDWSGLALTFAAAILLPTAWLFLSIKIPRPWLKNLLLLLAKLEKVSYSMAAVLLYIGYVAALAAIVGFLP